MAVIDPSSIHVTPHSLIIQIPHHIKINLIHDIHLKDKNAYQKIPKQTKGKH